ncbi:glycosyl hydrolase [Rhodococcus sp. NPDC057529]|uniref:glycosyl hydrolase 2 galactose-binding domain-containing protein n=1 Tax=Rhodococcus sp. NPDC057529 TaxID=3346158 RepID=UPI0036717934
MATEPGSVTDPSELAGVPGPWYPAQVPGTAAGAIRAADGVTAARAVQTDAVDWWFVTDVSGGGPGPWRLEFDGLASHAEVWAGDDLVLSSESMFVPVSVDMVSRPGTITLAIRFPSLDAALRRRRPRGRWRSSLVSAQGLRWMRTSLLGRAPVFGGVPAPVGPWRPVRLHDGAAPVLSDRHVVTTVEAGTGVLDLAVRVHGSVGPPPVVRLGDVSAEATVVEIGPGVRDVRAHLSVPDVRLWWPHTHGVPVTYPLSIAVGEDVLDLGAVGFRTVSVVRGDGGFRLSVNGVDVYCRGAVWTPVDPIGLGGRTQTRETLERVVEAGLNMVRVPGTMLYEDSAFWDDCAELGVLVWQDAMLSTFDPPDDQTFLELLTAEVEAVLRPLSGNPALAVFSGGSETEQQPIMLGLPAPHIPAVHDVIPAVVARITPGVVSVSSSPSPPPGGDALATHVGTGVAHYFGVGGYRLPPSDVRQAGVRFAAECLAFSIPPSDATIETEFGSLASAGHHPRWKAAVPRDNGASWDFEDVRDHYVRTLFGEEPSTVRWSDPERYLALGRAAVCEAVATTLGYWRRPDSGCDGALVLALRDLEPGAGWGLLDSDGRPKAPWFVMRRLSRPVAVLLGEDGMDGLRIDAVNDSARTLVGELRVRVHTRTGAQAFDVTEPVTVAAHAARRWSLDTLLGRFTDATHVHRFGVRGHESVTVTLSGEDGVVAEAVHLFGGPARAVERTVGLTAVARETAPGDWVVDVATDGAAQYVHLELGGFEPADSWFHLPPGGTRIVPVRRTGTAEAVTGQVRALNSVRVASVARAST